MKQVGSPPLPVALAALDGALGLHGASSLDPSVPTHVWRRALVGPAGEFLARPGKALRTTIVKAGWLLGGGDAQAFPDRLALVLELLHAGSLVIDDVEDDSLERRGDLALHRLIGTPLAINTGSWMYFWALAELADLGLDPSALAIAVRALVRCHQGQALDLSVVITELDPRDIAAVVATTTKLKTGQLCRLAAELGAIAAGASIERRAQIGEFAEAMGSGLQMLDDLGSLTCPERRDKGREDLCAARPTWPWAWLVGDPQWHELIVLAREPARVDELADRLSAATVVRGRACIRATLDRALADLRAAGANPIIDHIASELARMETSYG
ncbi:MAG: polyprenyl synthetase family protein [Kofleriaceae bacterium]